jgi:hypothetical protein
MTYNRIKQLDFSALLFFSTLCLEQRISLPFGF